jgi:hypothetical protein
LSLPALELRGVHLFTGTQILDRGRLGHPVFFARAGARYRKTALCPRGPAEWG